MVACVAVGCVVAAGIIVRYFAVALVAAKGQLKRKRKRKSKANSAGFLVRAKSAASFISRVLAGLLSKSRSIGCDLATKATSMLRHSLTASSPKGFKPLSEILRVKSTPNHVLIRALGRVVGHLEKLHSRREVSNLVELKNVYVLVSKDTQEVQDVRLVNNKAAPLAPEVVEGGHPTPASDIYALGELVGQCLRLNNSFLRLPIALCRLRRRALQEDPRDRPSITEARDYVAAALRQWRNPRPRLDM